MHVFPSSNELGITLILSYVTCVKMLVTHHLGDLWALNMRQICSSLIHWGCRFGKLLLLIKTLSMKCAKIAKKIMVPKVYINEPEHCLKKLLHAKTIWISFGSFSRTIWIWISWCFLCMMIPNKYQHGGEI